MNIVSEIRQKLIKLSDKNYQKFSTSLLPNIDNLLGVRLPVLRKLAKEIFRDDWQLYLDSESKYFEEIMLKGFVIGLVKDNPIQYLEKFIPNINNWSVCDSLCCSLKWTKSNKKYMLNFITGYLKSDKEFEIRFGLVMLLNYYVEDPYLDKIFMTIEEIYLNDYYAMMAAAWLISICFIKYPNKTLTFLKTTKLDKTTYNKSIQKIIESYRVDKNTKDLLRLMKK